MKLCRQPTRRPQCVRLQVLQALTQDLALTVLRSPPRASLSHLLLALPENFHELVIRAHDPSVDGRNSLHLDGLSGETLPLALSAASTLTHLTHLSLRDQQVPLPSAPLAGLLDSLRVLLCLDISNSLLPATVQHLAPALARCPRLTALDLSGNNLSAGGISALCPAFHGLRMLRVLSLRDTTCDAQEVSALAEHAHSLVVLHTLSVGAPSWRVRIECAQEKGSHALAQAVEALLVALRLVTSLRQLEVAFVGMLSSSVIDCAILQAVGGLSQLHSLKLPLPPASVMPHAVPSPSRPQWPLTHLTTLDIAEVPDIRAGAFSSMATSMLPDFGQMAALRRLRLPILLGQRSETTRLKEIVDTLAGLTALSFHIHDIHRPEWLTFLKQLPMKHALREVEVDVVSPSLTDEIASALASLAPCVSISAMLDDVPTMSSLVLLLPHIKWLVLQCIPTDESFSDFVSGMPSLSRLQQLEIGHMGALQGDAVVCRRFCECLPLLQSLQELLLSGDVPTAVVMGAAERVSELPSLRSLSFVLYPPQPPFVPVLLAKCEEHGHLRRLHLSVDGSALPDCSKLTTLQELQLVVQPWYAEDVCGSDEGSDDGTAWDGCAWVAGLQQLPRLRRLAVGHPGFGEECAAALVSAIHSGGLAALEVLDVTGCTLGDQAAALDTAVPAWVTLKPRSSGFMAM